MKQDQKGGYVYLLLYPTGQYKIGYSASAVKRHRQLQRMCPKRIYLIKSVWVPNPRKLERHLHQVFGTKKDRSGEFFCLSEQDVLRVMSLMSEVESY